MKIFIRLFKIIIIFILTVLLLLYLAFLFLLPFLFNNEKNICLIENFIREKKNINVTFSNLKLKTYADLSLKFKSGEIEVKTLKNEDIARLSDLTTYWSLFKNEPDKIDCDYIYINPVHIKEIYSKKAPSNKPLTFNTDILPYINVKEIVINNYVSDKDYAKIVINYLHGIKLNGIYEIILKCDVESSKLKNKLYIGDEGHIDIDFDGIYADNLSVFFGNSKLQLTGKLLGNNKNSNLQIKGKNLPVFDLEQSLLYFQKLKKPDKVFIENFYDFSGSIDVDLKYKNKGLYGECIAKELSANTVLFGVPVKFNKAILHFDNRKIYSDSKGTIGGEKLRSSFELYDWGLEGQHVRGRVQADLTDKIADKYIPDAGIKGAAKIEVNYTVNHGKIDVNYLLKLDKGSDLFYKNANLGLEDEKKTKVKTIKHDDKLEIVSYDYSLNKDNNFIQIIKGDGLMQKKNGHLALKYITCETNSYAPVSVTGSFGKYVKGGYFKGKLFYDAEAEQVTGNFLLAESKYKNFFLEKAVINADKKDIKILAEGKYDGYDFNWDLTAKNDFKKKIHIYNMYLFLDELTVRETKTVKERHSFAIPDEIEDVKIDIDNWQIKMNKISKNRIKIKDILVTGSLKDEIFKFSIPSVSFAQGKLSAKGKYNFNNNSASADFSASNINSNIAADVLFNLPDQIHGYAGANLHVQTGANLKDIKAHADFSINDGYLIKLGSTEFIIKKSKKIKRPIKIKIKDIINLDITKTKALSSNIKGSFDIDNFDMKNVKLTSQQKYLSILIEGKYNINSQYADLKLWGKYNKTAEKDVRILFIPLSWIVKIVFKPENTKELYQNKLDKIPSIVAKPNEEKTFRVRVKGNINDNRVKVELKSII